MTVQHGTLHKAAGGRKRKKKRLPLQASTGQSVAAEKRSKARRKRSRRKK